MKVRTFGQRRRERICLDMGTRATTRDEHGMEFQDSVFIA